MGHIRNLPESAKDIPEQLRKYAWTRLGVDIENNFEPIYTISKDKQKIVKHLKDLLKTCDELILATDEDREGEAIAWHLIEVLKPKVPFKRAVFHEITKEAITESFANLRDLHMNLVHAQEARRILDRLVGYTLSPILWKKIAPKLSAGRVQSVALAMIVQRELERISFQRSLYYDVTAQLSCSLQDGIEKSDNTSKNQFIALLVSFNGKRVAIGRDFDGKTGLLRKQNGEEVFHLQLNDAQRIKEQLEKDAKWKVKSLERRKTIRKAPLPFITSTLQQEGSKRLGLTAGETMRLAQDLYEQGFITYMRTDSPVLSNQARDAAHNCIIQRFGEKYLQEITPNSSPRRAPKLAQEAHEAIRPAGTSFVAPEEVSKQLSNRHGKLYELIYTRTLASQMKNAEFFVTSVDIEAVTKDNDIAIFHTSGRELVFKGFLKVYDEPYRTENAFDDAESTLERVLPALEKDQNLYPLELASNSHTTMPPARYTEAALIRSLEMEGVGRPSTYAFIIETLVERKYIRRDRSGGKSHVTLIPCLSAVSVVHLLNKHFPEITDPKFTASMEEALDDIANGKANHVEYLQTYFLGDWGLLEKAREKEKSIDSQEVRTLPLPIKHGHHDDNGNNNNNKKIQVKVGPYGPYIEWIGSEVRKTNLTNEISPEELCSKPVEELIQERNGKLLGHDSQTNQPVYLKRGRFGWFLQLGERDNTESASKTKESKSSLIKRICLPRSVDLERLDLETSLKWLSLPRNLGVNPETGKEIVASVGPFGPYISYDGKFISLKSETHNVFDIEYDTAMRLIVSNSMKPNGSLKRNKKQK